MAQLKIQRCQVCTRPLPENATVCPKCHTAHKFVPEYVNPLLFTTAQANELKEAFENQAAEQKNDAQSLFGKGLIYLGLQNYELAERNFKQAVDLTPGDPDVYYYYALSLFRHRSPAMLSDSEAEQIEMWLQTAMKMQPKRKYIILEMLLRQGAIKGKGKVLDSNKEEPEELLERALHTVQEEDELVEIEQHVPITDERNQEFIRQLRDGTSANAQRSQNGGNDLLQKALDNYSDLCYYPKGADDQQLTEEGVRQLLNANERRNFFIGLYQPERPKLESKDTYIGPFIRSIITMVGYFILFVILLIVVEANDFGMRDLKKSVLTAEQLTTQVYPDLKGKARAKKLAEVEEELARDAAKDSAFYAEFRPVAYSYRLDKQTTNVWHAPTDEEIAALPEGVEKIEITGLSRNWHLPAAIGILLLPLILWIVGVFKRFHRRFKERKAVGQRNRKALDDYDYTLKCYKNRPTVEEYKVFCQLYIGPNAGLIPVGDVVANALQQAKLSEDDVTKGKVYMFSSFIGCDDNKIISKEPHIALRRIGIDIAVAMPNRILSMSAIWDTTEDNFPEFDIDSTMYNQIATFKNTDGKICIISHSGTMLASIGTRWRTYENLFPYQSTDSNSFNYSRTRTTDSNDFYSSLIDMHGRYK